MYVCICSGVTLKEFMGIVDEYPNIELKELQQNCDIANQCCKCIPMIESILDEQKICSSG